MPGAKGCPPRYAVGVTMPDWDAEGFTEYKGFKIQKHFLRRDNHGKRYYEYRVVGYPTVYTDHVLACEEIEYLIHRRGLRQESC
jgi:hypothetical protein